MSFARWLLVHSFSIFIVTMFLLGYIYREELQLQQVYQQLLGQVENVAENIPQMQQESAPQVVEAEPVTALVKPPEPAPQPANIAEPVAKPPVLDDAAMEYLQSKPTVSRSAIELDDLMFKARKAYWDKDYETAIFFYQQLIQDDGDNPDYIGELGNIYYSINDFDNAAEHYYQAAIILIARNDYQQASLLLSPINAMNRKLGDQLRQKLTQRGALN